MLPGELVRSVRERRGLTQQELALRAGTTQTAISRLERGDQSPTVAHLEQLLLCLGAKLMLDVEDLVPWTDPADVAAFAKLSPSQRVHQGATASHDLARLAGAARRG